MFQIKQITMYKINGTEEGGFDKEDVYFCDYLGIVGCGC